MSPPLTVTLPESPTRHAVQKCAEWLAGCIRLGWRHEDLNWLEALWWKYHDNHGRLIQVKRDV